MSTEEELRLELERAQEKLHEWKAKAKVGVDKLREQCVQITAELEAQKAENAKLKKELALPPAAANVHIQPILSSQCLAVLDASSAQLEDVLTHSAAVQSDALNLLQHRWLQCHAELLASQEKYKKKAEQSIRLATRQQETLQQESRELHSALERALTELKERENAVEQRNLAVAALEKQLDTALYTVDSLRADIAEKHLHQQSMMNHGGEPHNGQGFISIDEVEREMEKIHEEFGSREALIHQQHRDELERLVRSHEQEMSLLEEELRDAARQDLAAATAAPFRDQKGSSRPAAVAHLNDDDEAYTSLMVENGALRKELKERDAAIAALQKNLKNNGSSVDEDAAGDRLDTEDLSPSMLRRKVVELEHQVQQLSEQLWVANNQMLETKVMQKEQNSMNTVQRKQTSDAQQASYLRSIIVRLICEKSEVVKANFIPVLTTLLQFEPEELRSIYVSNPTWAR